MNLGVNESDNCSTKQPSALHSLCYSGMKRGDCRLTWGTSFGNTLNSTTGYIPVNVEGTGPRNGHFLKKNPTNRISFTSMVLSQRQTSEVNWAFKINNILSNYKCECGPDEAPVVMCQLFIFLYDLLSVTPMMLLNVTVRHSACTIMQINTKMSFFSCL